MFSEKTDTLIKQAVDAEFENAKKNWGDSYHSEHEAYAVLLEEVEEVKREYKNIRRIMKHIWSMTKGTEGKDRRMIEGMVAVATNLAMEACQVAAVCRKIEGSRVVIGGER